MENHQNYRKPLSTECFFVACAQWREIPALYNLPTTYLPAVFLIYIIIEIRARVSGRHILFGNIILGNRNEREE